MKSNLFSKFLNIILYIGLAVTATAALGTAIYKYPFLLTSVYSNSMYPEFQRGDLLLIQNLNPTATLYEGDIVVFNTPDFDSTNNWVVHRLVGGDEASGFITKGDSNEYCDQDHGRSVRIQREWIVGRIVLLGTHAFKIPYVGFLSIWMEELQKSPFLIPGIIVVLALVLGTGGKKQKNNGSKNKQFNAALLYFLGGLVLSTTLCVSMIMISQHIQVLYDVSSKGKGAIQGSDIGILRVGDTMDKPLAEVKNNGFFPVIVAVTSNDKQIELSHDKLVMMSGDSKNVFISIHANEEGEYRSDVHVGLFYPFLPVGLVYLLASANYGLAVVAIALIPGLFLMVYPLFDLKMRRAILTKVRHGWSKLICSIKR